MVQDAERLQGLEARVDDAFRPPLWLETNYTEPRVNYAISDIVQTGWTAFDVGANFGGLTVTLSRLVGPRGVVCGFEANPIIAAKCQREMLRSGGYNTQLYQGAIYKRSGETIELFISDNAVADSIYRKTGRSIKVQTIALDDFVSRTRLIPQFVKMDIEGAEADALFGFEQTINSHSPILVLEHTPPDSTCFDFLLSKGYIAIDLQDYRRIRKVDDVMEGTVVTDLLYAKPESLVGTPYSGDLTPVPAATLDGDEFSWVSSHNYRSKLIDLPPGRYTAVMDFSATGNSNTMCGIWCEALNAAVVRVHASSSSLVRFARNIVFDWSGGPVHVFFSFLDTPDSSLAIESVRISRVPGFDGHRQKFALMA
jgi:FkbM family methyltransferase